MKSIQDAHSDYLRTIDSTGSTDTDQDNFFNKKRSSIPVNEKKKMDSLESYMENER